MQKCFTCFFFFFFFFFLFLHVDWASASAATRKHTMVGQKYFKGEGKCTFGGKNILNVIKSITIQNTSRRQDCYQGGEGSPPLVSDLYQVCVSHCNKNQHAVPSLRRPPILGVFKFVYITENNGDF